MEASGQIHARPLYPQGKSPWYTFGRRSGHGGKEKISEPLPGLDPPIIQPVAQRYITELSRLLRRRDTECKFNTRHQSAVEIHNIKINNKSLEKVMITWERQLHSRRAVEQIQLGKAYCRSVWNFSSLRLSKDIKFGIRVFIYI
jgi:hypothetical protein